mgnify:CR=1 FL=1
MAVTNLSCLTAVLAALAGHDADVWGFVPTAPSKTATSATTKLNVIGQQAESFGPADLLRKLKADLPQIDWLAEGDGSPDNKVNMPDYVREVLDLPGAPKRDAENEERTNRIRTRCQDAANDAQALKGISRLLSYDAIVALEILS